MSENPHFMLVTGDFNVRSSSWWKNNLRTSEGWPIRLHYFVPWLKLTYSLTYTYFAKFVLVP